MGTSSQTSGPGSNKPLVPSWLDGENGEPLPGGNEVPGQDNGDQNPLANGADTRPRPPLPLNEPSGYFQSARTNFSRFASSGGQNTRALGRAVGHYVRHGTGGSRNAVRRMGSSRTAAGKVLSVLLDIQRNGVQNTLKSLNLQKFVGQGIQDIFLGLTDAVCSNGGLIDDAVARDAWLETVANIAEHDISDPDKLTSDEINHVFLTFITETIKLRLYQDIGVNGFKFAKDLDAIDNMDRQLRDYIERGVRDSLQGILSDLSNKTDEDVQKIVDQSYHDAWDLLLILGETEK